ncbi:nucleoside diphosphate kinase regulator [Enterobacteriaceae bacterium LUAb1]
MQQSTIIINELDAERLDNLLEKQEYARLPVAQVLNQELDRATILKPAEIPDNIVTMNSEVEFRNLDTGETWTRKLVYPDQLTDSSTQISIMAPLGAALLGLKTGGSITWQLPGGETANIEVLALLYQPEAAGQYHR